MKQCRTKRPVKDIKGKFPTVQITYMGRTSDASVAEPYGTHGSSPLDTACLLITIGDEGNKYIIPLSAQTRPEGLKEGEFVTGNFKVGSIIKFDENGNILIQSKGEVNIEATKITANCDIEVTGGDVVADGISLKGHTHPAGDIVDSNSLPCSGNSGSPN